MSAAAGRQRHRDRLRLLRLCLAALALALLAAGASGTAAAAATGPVNTALPTVSGTAQAGQTLTASPGTWSGTQPISYAYQWRRCSASYAGVVRADSPVGYWRLGESSGTAAADSSGQGNGGTYSGGYTLKQAGAIAGDPDTAVRFNGATANGTVSVPSSSSLGYGDVVTYEVWIRLFSLPPSTSAGGNIATKSTGTLLLRVLPSGAVTMRQSAGNAIATSTRNLAVDGAYHYVVATKNGSSVHLYIDGVDVTGPVTNATLTNNTSALTIGHNPNSSNDGLDANMDEFAVYHRALTAAQVQQHYSTGTTSSCSDIVGATGQTYTAVSADVGSALRVAVTASNSDGSGSATSAATATVAAASATPPTNTAAPTMTGASQQGKTLTADPGSWSGTAPISYAYQWQRCDSSGANCTNIAGATSQRYALTSSDVGSTIRFVVTASNTVGQSSATSGASSVVIVAGSIGFKDQSFTGAGDNSPSGSKPESKLWWNDGSWWADMWDATSLSHHIFRLDTATQHWIDTGVQLDGRANTRSDTLWDGTHLYVASHVHTSCDCSTSSFGNPSRLYRFSYDPLLQTYRLDAGFPVTINNTASETLVIDKDSTGTIWATWAQDNKVEVAHTIGGLDQVWGTPFVLPVSGATGLKSDDISSLVAFGGNKIGIMWSNQVTSAMYFASHVDGNSDTQWDPSRTAVQGPNYADDHINLKSLQADNSGRVFAVVKTSLNDLPNPNPNAPLIMMLVRNPSTGDWSSSVFSRIRDNHTRAIMVLDSQHSIIHVFATAPITGGTIYEKTSPISSVSFAAGLGTPVIEDPANPNLNNATSTKQSVNSTTGLVVLATNSTTFYYWHAYESLSP